MEGADRLTGILDQIRRERGSFVLATTEDLFALELARQLGDEEKISFYARLAAEYPHLVLADAFHRWAEASKSGITADGFERELHEGAFRGSGRMSELIACRVERRQIAGAVFRGLRLVHGESLQLSAKAEVSARSVANFVGRLIDDHPQAAFGVDGDRFDDTRQGQLRAGISALARAASRQVFTVALEDLCLALRQPPLASREEVRLAASRLIPALDPLRTRPVLFDACAVGLTIQTKRPFWREELSKRAREDLL